MFINTHGFEFRFCKDYTKILEYDCVFIAPPYFEEIGFDPDERLTD